MSHSVLDQQALWKERCVMFEVEDILDREVQNKYLIADNDPNIEILHEIFTTSVRDLPKDPMFRSLKKEHTVGIHQLLPDWVIKTSATTSPPPPFIGRMEGEEVSLPFDLEQGNTERVVVADALRRKVHELGLDKLILLPKKKLYELEQPTGTSLDQRFVVISEKMNVHSPEESYQILTGLPPARQKSLIDAICLLVKHTMMPGFHMSDILVMKDPVKDEQKRIAIIDTKHSSQLLENYRKVKETRDWVKIAGFETYWANFALKRLKDKSDSLKTWNLGDRFRNLTAQSRRAWNEVFRYLNPLNQVEGNQNLIPLFQELNSLETFLNTLDLQPGENLNLKLLDAHIKELGWHFRTGQSVVDPAHAIRLVAPFEQIMQFENLLYSETRQGRKLSEDDLESMKALLTQIKQKFNFPNLKPNPFRLIMNFILRLESILHDMEPIVEKNRNGVEQVFFSLIGSPTKLKLLDNAYIVFMEAVCVEWGRYLPAIVDKKMRQLQQNLIAIKETWALMEEKEQYDMRYRIEHHQVNERKLCDEAKAAQKKVEKERVTSKLLEVLNEINSPWSAAKTHQQTLHELIDQLQVSYQDENRWFHVLFQLHKQANQIAHANSKVFQEFADCVKRATEIEVSNHLLEQFEKRKKSGSKKLIESLQIVTQNLVFLAFDLFAENRTPHLRGELNENLKHLKDVADDQCPNQNELVLYVNRLAKSTPTPEQLYAIKKQLESMI